MEVCESVQCFNLCLPLIPPSVLTDMTMPELSRRSTGLGFGLGEPRTISSISAACIASDSFCHGEGLPEISDAQSHPYRQPMHASNSSSSTLHAVHIGNVTEAGQSSIPVQHRVGLNARDTLEIPDKTSRSSSRSYPSTARTQSSGAEQQSLRRHRTLLSAESSPAKQATELKSLLGNANAKIKSGTSIVFSPTIPPPGTSPRTSSLISQPLTLEKAKSRARVEVDLLLSCDTFVQGQSISGQLVIRIPKRSKKKSPVLMKDGKLRIIGYECLAEGAHRHVFYQCSQRMEDVSYASDQIYFDGPEQGDEEGYRSCREGHHVFPFEMSLPVKQEGGNAKGTVDVQGVAVRYITMMCESISLPFWTLEY